jgi:tetratricopeptide (TPR) repeat protein
MDNLRGDERTDFRRVVEECLAGTKVDNDRAGGHLNAGILFQSLGQWSQAEDEYQTAILVEPNNIGPRTNLADLYDNQFEAARQRAIELARGGDRASAEREIAAAGDLPGKIDQLRTEELGLLERDVLLAPDVAAIQEQIGLTRILGRWTREAETALVTATLLEPRNPAYLHRLAQYYVSTERAAEALPLAQRLVKLRPGSKLFRDFAEEVEQRVRNPVHAQSGNREQ